MKILYISNNSSVGGAPAALLNLVRIMCRKHEVAVMMPDADGPLYKELEAMGVRCYTSCKYCLSIWPRVLNPIKFLKRIADLRKNRSAVRAYVGKVLDDFCPDIVHTNVGPLDIAVYECQKRSIPHVWHLREYQDLDFGMAYFPGGAREFKNLIRQEDNHCIAITSGVYSHWGLNSDAKVIYDGVIDEDAIVSQSKAYDDRQPYFIYAARIEKGKGLKELLKAFKSYRNGGGKYSLKVAGRPCGLYAFMCRMYVRLHGLSEQVSFLGNRSDVPELMAQAAAAVIPSRFEGFGFTTVEAMYNHCLVIGKDTAGTKEQFDNGKSLKNREIGFRYTDVRELASLLSKVENMDAEAAELMRRDAYETVTALYCIGRYAREVEEYYLSIRRKANGE